jgi:hypothetical protein
MRQLGQGLHTLLYHSSGHNMQRHSCISIPAETAFVLPLGQLYAPAGVADAVEKLYNLTYNVTAVGG